YLFQHDACSGHMEPAGDNLQRQAGTTLVLCELGAGTETAPAIERALEQMASLEVRVGEKSLLVYPEDDQQPALGSQALPLIAFLSCRERVGERYDPLIGRLAASLLARQREEGGVQPAWDLKRYQPHAGSPPLFSPGQAVMALVLLERLVS